MKTSVYFFTYILLFGGAGFAESGEPGFDIINKTEKSVYIILSNGGNVLTGLEAKEVAPFKKTPETIYTPSGQTTLSKTHVSLPIDIQKETRIRFYSSPCMRLTGLDCGTHEPSPEYTFTANKNIYVTWKGFGDEKKGILEPQTGSWKGWSGTTEGGFSTKNKANKADIKLVTTKSDAK